MNRILIYKFSTQMVPRMPSVERASSWNCASSVAGWIQRGKLSWIEQKQHPLEKTAVCSPNCKGWGLITSGRLQLQMTSHREEAAVTFNHHHWSSRLYVPMTEAATVLGPEESKLSGKPWPRQSCPARPIQKHVKGLLGINRIQTL